MTNLDKIKSMDLEEMVYFLCHFIVEDCDQCKFKDECFDFHNGVRSFLQKKYEEKGEV